MRKSWVAVKEVKLSYYNKETLSFTTYPHYDTILDSKPDKGMDRTSESVGFRVG